jgi:hypothetical protein
MTTAQVLERLQGVRRSGAGWAARCPAHPDRSPSLSIREGERGTLLHCFAQCSLESICAALGIRVRELFFQQSSRPAENPTARQARRAAIENLSKNLPREWRNQETVVVYVSERFVAEGIARALALTLEGEPCVAVLAHENRDNK